MRNIKIPLVIVLICLGAVPILNLILPLPSLFHIAIVGRDTDWLQFWACYIPGIAEFIMIYYTYCTIVSAHKDNVQNRKFQQQLLNQQADDAVLLQFNNWLDKVTEYMNPLVDIKLRDLIQKKEYAEAAYYGQDLLSHSSKLMNEIIFLCRKVLLRKILEDFLKMGIAFKENINCLLIFSNLFRDLESSSNLSQTVRSFKMSLKENNIGEKEINIINKYIPNTILDHKSDIIDKVVELNDAYPNQYSTFIQLCQKLFADIVDSKVLRAKENEKVIVNCETAETAFNNNK